MMNNQSKDADSKARARAEQSARREREAERRRKAEEERRRREAERKAEAQRRAREEERKRKEEQARQEALEAAQSGWQPPQVQNREQARTGTLTDAAAKLDGLIEGIRNSARAGTKPPASQLEQWQPNTIRKATEKDAPQSYAEAVYGGAKAQPKEAETRMAGQLMAGKAKAQAGPYTRTLMDNVLAHEGDTDDPFLMELNSESWEQEYKDDRTKAFKDAVERLADQLMTGKAKPEEAVPAREKRETTVTSGDLADPFLQGLFGEQELKDEFVKGQLKQFAPALERRIAQLREKVSGNKVSGQTEEERQKDTAYGTNMVYTMKKDEAWPTREELITGRTEIDPRMAGNIMQPMSAQVSNPPQQGNAEDKTSTEAAQFGWQPPQQGNAEDKTSTEGAQFGWQAQGAKTAGGSDLDLGMGPITQEKADEVRAAGAQTLTPEETGIRDWLEANPDAVLPNGINAETLKEFEKFLPDKGTEMITVPSKDGADFPDFTDKLTKYLEEIVEECRTAKDEQGVLALADWINKVRPEGVWDPKSNTKQIREVLGYSENEKLPDRFYFNGRLMNLEEIGNLMYGVSGSAIGFSPEALLMGSQAVQGLVDFGRNFNNPVFGDEYLERLEEQKRNEQKDQDVIRRGMDYYEKHFEK